MLSIQSSLTQDLLVKLHVLTLPLSLYTEMYWQIDLHNLFHFLRLRLDAHAQKKYVIMQRYFLK